MAEKRLLIISDSHGRNENITEAVRREWPLQGTIHLGDFECSLQTIMQICPGTLDIVAGNCDPFSKVPREKIIPIGRYTAFLVHGSGGYAVSMDRRRLAAAAAEHGCQIALFGHIHRPVDEVVDGVHVINPGSISNPRQKGYRRSYGIMTVRGDGSLDYSQKYL